MPTEKTPLTSSSSNFGSAPTQPFYVQDTYRFYSRRRRERQLQCIMFVTIVATFIMALIVTISYSVNQQDVFPTNATNVSVSGGTDQALPVQQAGQPRTYVQAATGGEALASVLSSEEVRQALAAGNAAIATRRAADSASSLQPLPSPNARHQLAVSTSPRADQLAYAAVAEIAATRKIESARSFMGAASSFGSFLDGGWAPEDTCARELKIQCPVYASKYRRFDGSCNHPQQLGMAYTPYSRVLPPDYADGIGAPRIGKFGNPLPSAREVSLKVHPPSPSTNPSFTVMLAVFGQFLDHDITATAISQGSNSSLLSCCPPNSGTHPECFPVKVSKGDPVYDLTGSSCMEFVRSAPAAQCKIGSRQQLNQVTSFIDASTIYGSDLKTAESLREFSVGRLRMQITPDKRELLPSSTTPQDGCNREQELARGRYCFSSGDARANENLHLTTMHLLWARQHNRLAGQLTELNPQWDDEKVYQETRRIVGAQLQHVTYSEFLPIVLGESELVKRNLKPLSTGFRTKPASTVDPTIANHFAAAAFRFAHTLLPGLMKVTDREKGTSSYVQLHKMLFNPYSLYSAGGVESSITTTTSNAIQKTSTHVSSQLTEHLFEDPMANQTTIPCGLDLVSLNIQRGRDHGLPGYTRWREHCGLKKPLNFDDLKDGMDDEAFNAISKLYDNVDDVDLYTGALAEIPKGDGLVGPTFTCLIANQFERLQTGDKYWYELANQVGSFSEDQLIEIRKTSLARIICDNSDGITEIQAQVMRSVSLDNPMISCEDIPKLSLDAWKTEMPSLKTPETVVPVVDWLYFKNQVNSTITDIISTIAAMKPPPDSLPSDWIAFQQNINATFSDLGNKFSALHPKAMTNITLTRNLTSDISTFDWIAIKNQVDYTVSEIIDSVAANKPAPSSLPADWLIFKKKINDSLLDIRKKFKLIHPKVPPMKASEISKKKFDAVPIFDWNKIKSDINVTIIDVIGSINSSKPLPGSSPADWFAFRKKINDTLAGIKKKFIGLYPKAIETMNEPSNDTAFDWIEVEKQLNKSLDDIIISTASKSPTPGSTAVDWLEFQKELNTTFSRFLNKFPHNQTDTSVNNSSSTIDDYVSGENNDVNKTINDIIAEINANRPLPGSTQEDWLAFRKKMNDTFSSMQNKYVNVYTKGKTDMNKKSNLKLSGMADFDTVGFRENLNKSLTDLISIVKTTKPGINSSSTDWAAYRKRVKVSVSALTKEISQFPLKQFVEDDTTENVVGSDLMFDWVDWQNHINESIDGLMFEIKTIPPEDSKSSAFQSSLNKMFIDLKNRVASIKIKSLKSKLLELMNADLSNFKDRIISTIEVTLDDIKNSKPGPGDPSWATYGVSIKNRFAKIGEDVISLKTEWFEKVKVATEMMTLLDTKLSMIDSSASTNRLLQTKGTFYIFSLLFSVVLFAL